MIAQELSRIFRRVGMEYFKRYYASYRGTVVDNADPEHKGRLQVMVNSIYSEPYDYWAHPKGMVKGSKMGISFIPDIGDQVWVSFENGLPRFPIWEYGNWRTDDVPDIAKLGVQYHFILTKANQSIIFDDIVGAITIKNSKGAKVVLKDTHINLIPDGAGKVNLGSEGAGLGVEKGVKGQTLETLLNQLFAQIQAITVPTAFGASGTPINTPAFQAIQATIQTILSNVVTTK
jgi:hypothetical protein